MYKEENKHQQGHLQKGDFWNKQMDDEVILKGEGEKTGEAKPHNAQKLRSFVFAHYVKKAVEFFKELNPVQKRNKPADIKITGEHYRHKNYSNNGNAQHEPSVRRI